MSLNTIASSTSQRQQLLGGLMLLLIAAVTVSWLVFPYLFSGKKILSQTGADIKLGKIERSQTISQLLSRRYITPAREEFLATFATKEYFKFSNQSQAMGELRPDKYHIFFITESIHTGRLPATLPDITLLLPDSSNIKPFKVDGPSKVEHHRLSYVYFDRYDTDGKPVIPETGQPFRLVMENSYGDHRPDYVGWFEWTYPPELPEGVKQDSLFSPLAVVSLSIGLLSAVLTPCMLQMSLMYFAVLSGSSGWANGDEAHKQEIVKRQMRRFSIAFITGFVLLFTLVGALIGWSGQLMQAWFSLYTTQISVASGILVLVFGFYLAYQARMPLVCKIPLQKFARRIENHSLLATTSLSIAYALGCITCFGGAIIGTLMIYVGTLESPFLGASIMALFAIGVGIPFFIAALLMSKTESVMAALQRWQRPIQIFTALVVIFFGLVLTTDNYHTVSDFIYPYLGLD
jgi:cytochrome c-type biogenesis protein